MLTRQHLLRTRCVLVACGATALAAVATRVLLGELSRPLGSTDQVLVRGCVLALLGAAGWSWLTALGTVAEAWSGRADRARCRSPLRRAVLLCCGIALAVPAGAAAADDHRLPPATIAGLPLPDRATGPAHPRGSEPPSHRTVVVRAGDCLWHLAAADLSAEATDAEIEARWRAIHRLNTAVIGPDPNLLHPGQRLVLPPH
jgi:nucleoid-associated protein YgaU